MSKITGNIVGLPNPLSKVKAEIEKPKSEIQFSNGIKLTVNENTLKVVAKGEEGETVTRTFVDGRGDTFANIAEEADTANYAYEADYAGEAGHAEYASSDEDGRFLKGTIITDIGDTDNAELYLDDGCAFYYGIISTSVIAYCPEEPWTGFTSGLYFTTPSVIPEGSNYSQFPKDIHFKGDSTDEGTFVPEPDTRYTIVFDFDGYMLNGYVSGVPAPPVSEVTENE